MLIFIVLQNIESIFELLEDDDVRDYVLSMEGQHVAEAAAFCNAYPSIEVEHKLSEDSINM